jgi:membrane protease YdiL (CAAX protease family)
MNDSPLVIIALFAGAVYLAKLWFDDLKRERAGDPNPSALPGTTTASALACIVAAAGALLLVGIETGGEIALGVSAEQSDITAIFLLAMVAAGFIEEIVFRGYLVVTSRGKAILIASIIGFSALFALLHVQYYTAVPEDGSWTDFSFDLNAKSSWTLLILFINSLWFYAVRFFPLNPRHSLLPCIIAHIASNLGVFFVKLAQGHVTAWF